METFNNLLFGFGQAFTGGNLLYVFAGSAIGTWIGMLPGIGPATALAVLLPFAASMDPTSALILLSGIYFGAMYGGALSSVLLNIPGDASAIIPTIEGHPLATQGRGGPALTVIPVRSFVGGMAWPLALTFPPPPSSPPPLPLT